MATYSPFVYWAQSENSIFLKIDLKDVKEPDIEVEEKTVSFNGSGTGALGIQKYGFKILLFETIKGDGTDQSIKITDRGINITLNKIRPGWWPRLISAPQKPTWLKIDFDKWQSEDDLLDEKVNDVALDYPDVYNNLMKNELGYIKEDFKAVYLPFYNLTMLCAFLYIAIILAVTIAKTGLNETLYAQTYPLVGRTVLFIQHLQGLEIMHAYCGYVRGHCLMPFLQIFGRLAILVNLELDPRLQKMPVVTWLFLTWAYGDIIRYIYYILNMTSSRNTFKQWVYPVAKWLRYTAWILLYPIGFLCESVIIFRNILYLHAEPRYYLRMPNKFNATFDLLIVLRLYLLFVALPGMYFLLKHMYKSRVKALGGKEPFDKLGLGFLKNWKKPCVIKTK